MDDDVINDGLCTGVLVDSKIVVFVIRFHQISKRSRKGGKSMKKVFLLFIIISLVVYGSLGLAVVSEAKDKLSKHDKKMLEEFKLSLKNSSEGRFQAELLDGKSILIIDTKLGHLWILRTSPEPIMKYAGKVRPGQSFWKTIHK